MIDQPLDEALDFERLKKKGIDQLKRMVGHEWSNYNDSDPGVTILDQLCYALTELGYCAEFPIADVLTSLDGKINYKDQFFAPTDILTTSPVTIDDYRKLVHDRIEKVRAIYIEPELVEDAAGDDQTVNPLKAVTGRYRSYLCVEDGEQNSDLVLKQVHYLLNQHRNLGELFLPPILLQTKEIQLAGKVYLSQSADAEVVYKNILSTLSNYAAPQPIRSGYNELLKQLQTDRILNGPQLSQGWIAALECKCSSINIHLLSCLIAEIEGVLYVESLSFLGTDEVDIPIAVTEIADIQFLKSLLFQRNAVSIKIQSNQIHYSLEMLKANHQTTSVAAKVDLAPDLPQGRYRNIEQYYSVQNTFPDVYGIGNNSHESDFSSYRIAQSRQLKGYLMFFDQLLANQFSQLAHIGDLFSFSTFAGEVEQGSTLEGRATKPFARTYYSQPLYDVPDVKPLLRGHDAFHFQYDPNQPDRQVEQEAWKKFKKFPFNEYIYGLRDIMESDTEATQRRDDMLSHLMARHGDDASLYDDMIKTCQWFGSDIKTRIIVKSIWLQNYQKLSYSRNCAFDFLTARHLPTPRDSSQIISKYLETRCSQSSNFNIKNSIVGQQWWRYPSYPTINGELDQARIYAEAKLNVDDFANFSTFELKADILLGLSAHLRAIAAKLFALLDDPTFDAWLTSQSTQKQDLYHFPNSDVSVTSDSEGKKDQIHEGQQPLMDIEWSDAVSRKGDYLAHAEQLVWLSMQCKGFLLIEHILLIDMDKEITRRQAKVNGLSATLIFPNYVTLTQQPNFRSFIDTLIDLHWPAHISLTYQAASFNSLEQLIAKVVSWRSDLSDSKFQNELATQLGL